MKKPRSPRPITARSVVPATWYTVKEVAVRYHRTPAVVREWLRNGSLGGKRIGGGWLISDTDLATFEAQF